MRATKMVVLWLAIGACFSAAQSGEIEHKYGMELHGGYGLYLNMTDPNDFVKGFTGSSGWSQKEYSESGGAFSGGLSLLYKSEPYFAWHIGFTALTSDSATAIATKSGSPDQVTRVFVNTVELYLMANYYWNVTPRFNLEFGAGPAFYLSSMDREVPSGTESVYGDSYYGAHGRSFGFKGDIGLEFFLSSAVSLKLGGGFRFAPVTRFKYFKESGSITQGQIAYWGGTNNFNTFEADFSGAYADVGLRIYFNPASAWNSDDQ